MSLFTKILGNNKNELIFQHIHLYLDTLKQNTYRATFMSQSTDTILNKINKNKSIKSLIQSIKKSLLYQ